MIYAMLFIFIVPLIVGLCCCNIKNSEIFVTWKGNNNKRQKKSKKKQKQKSTQNYAQNEKFYEFAV
jgi:hypothetical protein